MNPVQRCFKAYDIRGKAPEELNPAFCRALGSALIAVYEPKKVVIGRDTRLSSPTLADALIISLLSQGVDVMDLGVCGTEEMYYAAAHGDFDLGIMITGSHNPANENGFKFVTRGAIPVSADSGLDRIAAQTAAFLISPAQDSERKGNYEAHSLREQYLDWLLKYSGLEANPERKGFCLRIVADAGNGCAGPVLEALAERLPVEFISLNFEPDGSFPNGVPNPLLPEKRKQTAEAVQKYRADLGVAFDGDFDRCFFFDHKGRFVESCYLIGLLASSLLMAHPENQNEIIVHDPRVYWNTRDLIIAMGGMPVMSRGGHSYMKETMRKTNALYGGEMSGHHFYRDFSYCDSGMLTMLLMIGLLLRSGQTLAELVEAGMAAYPCSGEANFQVADPAKIISEIWQNYRREAIDADQMDGISLEFPEWRFNLRASNTEPLLRLNIESRGDPELVKKKLAELTRFIED